jgi:uncharacterized protein with NRDE domain
MCLIAVAWRAHPDFPLVVAGNRDEFFARPTEAAHWWDEPELLAGRDLQAGGTWMGVTCAGRFAALTNHRDPSSQRPDAPSRGALVGSFLASASKPFAALDEIARDASRYNGFNLLAGQWQGDDAGLWVVDETARVTALAPGVHGLSNARVDTPWPKVDHAIAGTREALASTGDADTLIARLFALLDDRTIAPDDRLPHTGVSRDTERALSAPFIRMPGYGTRASTVLLVARDGRVTFVERLCEPDTPVVTQRYAFETSAARAP